MKKVVVIGPESTGKSTLCENLARHYNTRWCPEYARAYLLEHGTDYTFDNLLTVAKGQISLEDELTHLLEKNMEFVVNDENKNSITSNNIASPLLIVDTEMYVLKVWCEFVFGKCHNWIIDQIVKREYDLYLLCNVDLPWVKDELREYPDLETRAKLYHIYKDIMINQNTTWIDVSGNYDERMFKATTAIDKLLKEAV